jgi:hypothetical protein
MALPPLLNSVIEWLRAGYPEGVPDVDYVPLFALLGSQLSKSDVKAVAEEPEHMSKPESFRNHSGRPQYLGPTNSSSRATASRRATEIELRRE